MIFCRASMLRKVEEIMLAMQRKNYAGASCKLRTLKRELEKVGHPGRPEE